MMLIYVCAMEQTSTDDTSVVLGEATYLQNWRSTHVGVVTGKPTYLVEFK